MNDELHFWEEIIAKIRKWDRDEHTWATIDKRPEHKNIKTKERLIKELMSEYKLEKQLK